MARDRSFRDRRILVFVILVFVPPLWNAGSEAVRVLSGRARILRPTPTEIALGRELDRLRETMAAIRWLGGIEPTASVRLVPAEFLRVDDLSPLRRSFWLCRGRRDGIAAGDPVVAATPVGPALVGRIAEVYSFAARVQTAQDARFRVLFATRGSPPGRADGMLAGNGERRAPAAEIRGGMRVHLLASEGAGVGFREGEPLYTAGGDQSFPAGLLIGYVVKPPDGGASSSGLIPEVEIRPPVDPRDLTEVLVWHDDARREVAGRSRGRT